MGKVVVISGHPDQDESYNNFTIEQTLHPLQQIEVSSKGSGQYAIDLRVLLIIT